MANNTAPSKEPLNNFFDESYGYNKIPSGQNAPELFLKPATAKKAREISINTLSNVNQPANLSKLKNEILSPDYAQNQPLFIDIIVNQPGIPWRLNRQAKPFVFQLENNPAYQKAEAATDHDSSLYALVAATVSDTASRKEIYNIVGKLVCHGVQNSPDIHQRIENVFLGKDNLSTALVMAGVHQRTDLFPGISVVSQTDMRLNYNSRQVDQWTQNWQKISQGIEEKLNQGKKLSLTDIKNIEVFSHLFKVDKIISRIIDQPQTATVAPSPKTPEVKKANPQSEKNIIDQENQTLLNLISESLQHPQNKKNYGLSRLENGAYINRLINSYAYRRFLQKQNPKNSLDMEINEIQRQLQQNFNNIVEKEKNVFKQHSKLQQAIDLANVIYEEQSLRAATR
jgi:hypothetical protein